MEIRESIRAIRLWLVQHEGGVEDLDDSDEKWEDITDQENIPPSSALEVGSPPEIKAPEYHRYEEMKKWDEKCRGIWKTEVPSSSLDREFGIPCTSGKYRGELVSSDIRDSMGLDDDNDAAVTPSHRMKPLLEREYSRDTAQTRSQQIHAQQMGSQQTHAQRMRDLLMHAQQMGSQQTRSQQMRDLLMCEEAPSASEKDSVPPSSEDMVTPDARDLLNLKKDEYEDEDYRKAIKASLESYEEEQQQVPMMAESPSASTEGLAPSSSSASLLSPPLGRRLILSERFLPEFENPE
jgi:hypothetical protein